MKKYIDIKIRIEWIISMLTTGKPFNSGDIKASFGASKATVKRDMNLIREHYNISVKFDARENTYYMED